MYLNPFSIKSHKDDQGTVIDMQLDGWVYESHCWVVIKSHNHNEKVCRWCGAKSHIDMVIKGADKNTICPENPLVKGHTTLKIIEDRNHKG